MKHIIIVDDALDLGRVLQTMLLTLDSTLSIRVVPSGEEAMLETTRRPVDLLVSDIRLPGMTGIELVRKVRLRQPGLKAILITGLSDEKILQQAKAIKPEALLHKPLDFTEFLQKARACLSMPVAVPLPPTPPPPPSEPVPEPGTHSLSLAERVSGLRQALGAQAVFVLDERGKVVAQAGDVPQVDLEASWTPALFGALSASNKVARLLDGSSSLPAAQVFTGAEFSLVLAPAGDYALLVVIARGRSSLRLPLAVEEVLAAQGELGAALKPLTPNTPPTAPLTPPPSLAAPAAAAVVETLPAVPQPEPEPGPELQELEQILKQPSEGLKTSEIDAYWDALVETGSSTPTSPDELTYDQASRLGLAPEDPKK
jgi:CheY-like chemotaxis protein